MNGYLICRDGAEALASFEEEGVRFVASLDDGQGFVAFDGEVIPHEHLRHGARLYTPQAMEPHPDYPDTWPDWLRRKAAPKRAIATGREHYALLSAAFLDYLSQQETVTGIALVTGEMLLVESDGPISAGAGWSAGVMEFRDKRLEYAHS